MEESMELVAQKCGKQLNDYQRCLLASRNGSPQDARACEPYQRALAQCSADAVPLIAATKRACAPQIRAYDACLARHVGAPQYKGDERAEAEGLQRECGGMLKELWRCTEMVKLNFAKEGGADPKMANQAKDAKAEAQRVLGLKAGGS